MAAAIMGLAALLHTSARAQGAEGGRNPFDDSGDRLGDPDQHPQRPRVLTWMRRAFVGAFVALGAKLALADR
jgi:hypothetical protein